jgi:hypothetical protein
MNTLAHDHGQISSAVAITRACDHLYGVVHG